MRVKIDEQLSQLLKGPLIEVGHDALTVLDQNLSGTIDEKLWPIIQKEDRFFITGDKEFGDIRKYPPGTHHGVLLLRPDYESIVNYLDLLKSVLKKHPLETLKSTISVATPRGIRVRTAL